MARAAPPELDSVRAALRQVLAGHDPYPAVIVDRWWELLDANEAVAVLVEGSAPELLEPPVNVLRLSLHPGGMAETVPAAGVVLPMHYQAGQRQLSLFSISAVVGTATDVTVEELAVEAFYPADAATAQILRSIRPNPA